MANLTLSVDDAIVERARQVARQQGTSLDALIRQYIESLAGRRSGALVATQMRALWNAGTGDSRGRGFRREDAYPGRIE